MAKKMKTIGTTALVGGMAGMAGALMDPVSRMANAGLEVTASGLASHIVGSGVVGAGMGAAAGGALLINEARKRHAALRAEQFDK